MKTTRYHIYIIKELFDEELGATAQRWALSGAFASRRLALYKARVAALQGGYSRIEVLRREICPRGKCTSKMMWAHKKGEYKLGMRLKQKSVSLRRRSRRKKTA